MGSSSKEEVPSEILLDEFHVLRGSSAMVTPFCLADEGSGLSQNFLLVFFLWDFCGGVCFRSLGGVREAGGQFLGAVAEETGGGVVFPIDLKIHEVRRRPPRSSKVGE